jgi:hypothetical protein
MMNWLVAEESDRQPWRAAGGGEGRPSGGTRDEDEEAGGPFALRDCERLRSGRPSTTKRPRMSTSL